MSEKNLNNFYDGWLYHLFVDPFLRKVRRLVRRQVEPGSSLIDIGCGTGELVFSLADWCKELVGLETSKRMWSYANKRARMQGFSNVQILFGDGANLDNLSTASFDNVTACMVLHEMDASQRFPVLKEMQRLAPNLLLVDYRVPPPANLTATMCRFIERLAGPRHFRNYTSFINGGGLLSLNETLGLSVNKEITFYSQCLHLVLLG